MKKHIWIIFLLISSSLFAQPTDFEKIIKEKMAYFNKQREQAQKSGLDCGKRCPEQIGHSHDANSEPCTDPIPKECKCHCNCSKAANDRIKDIDLQQNAAMADIDRNRNAENQRNKQQNTYEEFKREKQEQQQREFNEHIQRQNTSNERFSNTLNVAGNLLYDILQAGSAKKRAIGESFVLSYIEKLNKQKSNIKYYESKEPSDDYPKVDYKIDEEYEKITNSIALNNFLMYLTKYHRNDTYNGYDVRFDAKSTSSIITPNYKGSIRLLYVNNIFKETYLSEYLKIYQTLGISFLKNNGSGDSEAQLGMRNSIGGYSISHVILFSIFDIYKIKNVSNQTESVGDGTTITYSNNQIQLILTTGEYVNFTIESNPSDFISNLEELLENAKKEVFLNKAKLENKKTVEITENNVIPNTEVIRFDGLYWTALGNGRKLWLRFYEDNTAIAMYADIDNPRTDYIHKGEKIPVGEYHIEQRNISFTINWPTVSLKISGEIISKNKLSFKIKRQDNSNNVSETEGVFEFVKIE